MAPPPVRPAARPAAPARPAMPSFALEKTLDEEIAGQKLRFYSIGALALLKLEPIAGRLLAGMGALFNGGSDAEQRAGLLEVFTLAGQHPELVGYLILDSLHDEEWNARPPQRPAIEAFLARVDGPSLLLMVQSLVYVNLEAAVPLMKRLTGRDKGKPPEPVSPTEAEASTT